MGKTAAGIILDNRPAGGSPLFSVVVALYNAETTMEATLSSFDSQLIDASQLEFLVINDGSDDDSLAVATRWAGARSNVVLVDQENGGIAAARNAALNLARGKWVTAVDPDDCIEPRYFAEVKNFLTADHRDELSLLSTRVLVTQSETGRFGVHHPLDGKFRQQNRVVALSREPNSFAIGATTFLRVQTLRENGLSFDERISPTFEDGNLILRYLCHFEEPLVGLVASAHYFYRKSSAGGSAVQNGWTRDEKYSNQLEYGYLGALEYGKLHRGETPNWMALAVLYDLVHYFKEFERFNSKSQWATERHGETFLRLCRRIFEYLTPTHLDMLSTNVPPWGMGHALFLGLKEGGSPGTFRRTGVLREGGVEYVIVHTAAAADLSLCVDGNPVRVRPDGVKTHSYYGEVFAVEATVFLPEGATSLAIGGISLSQDDAHRGQRGAAPPEPSSSLTAMCEELARIALPWSRAARIRERIWVESLVCRKTMLRVVLSKVRAHVLLTKQRRSFTEKRLLRDVNTLRLQHGTDAGCWVLLDHPDRADDNAEHLYRYVRAERPDVNAFFLLERESPDWARLAEEGFALLEYGSPRAIAAILAARFVLSSDATGPCMYPAPRKLFPHVDYDFVFLQHGVLVSDISGWLRGKDIALMVSSSPAEYQSLVWKDSPYDLQSSQVILSGLPRYDSLLRAAQELPPSPGTRSQHLLVMPTWRKDLSQELAEAGSPERRRRRFRDSAFKQAWWSVLEAPELKNAIRSGSLTIDFVLHPNLPADLLVGSEIEGIQFLDIQEERFQELLTRCDLFLTDYSSLAVDAAYLEKTVGYYQFDADSIGAGRHSWSPGYFDFRKNGFGPVFDSPDEVAGWLVAQLPGGQPLEPTYAARIQEAFAHRDTDNCSRLVTALQSVPRQGRLPVAQRAPEPLLPPML